MKVKELIEILQKLNPEAIIIPEPIEGMNLRQTFYFFQGEGWREEIKEEKDVS